MKPDAALGYDKMHFNILEVFRRLHRELVQLDQPINSSEHVKQ